MLSKLTDFRRPWRSSWPSKHLLEVCGGLHGLLASSRPFMMIAARSFVNFNFKLPKNTSYFNQASTAHLVEHLASDQTDPGSIPGGG